MRRSRSQTSIPLLKGRERTRSLSRTGSVSRNASLDKKLTPLPNLGVKRSQKNSYLTPSTPIYLGMGKRSGYNSSIGQSGSRGVSSVNMKAKQDQIKDKKWVSEQYQKCKLYISSCGKFACPSIADSIRPPTIKILVEIMSTMLEQIFGAVNMNAHNYAEVLVSHLKLLSYPGSLSVSSVKSCNTMHGFPQFIGILSWLIDKVLQPEEDPQPLELEQESQLHKSVFRFFSTNYMPWSSGIADRPTEESVMQLRADFSVGLEQAVEIQEQIEMVKADIEKAEENLESLSKKKLDLENEIRYKQNVIDTVLNDDGEEDLRLHNEITEMERKIEIQKKCLQEKEEHIQSLKNQQLSQPCTIQEKKELLREIEDKKRYIARLKETTLEYQKMRDDLDREIRELVLSIEKNVDGWNIAIVKTFLPEFEKLQLPSKGFHSPAFLEEVERIKNEKLILESKFRKEYEDLEVENAKLKEQEELLKVGTDFKKLDDCVETAKLHNDRLKLEIKEAQDRLLAEKNEMENFAVHMQQTLGVEISEQETKLKDARLKLREVEKRFEEIGQAGIECITTCYREGVQIYRQIDDMANMCLVQEQSKLVEERNKMVQLFDNLCCLYKTIRNVISEVETAPRPQ
ncbi:kinetochore protein NDC80 homolog [Cylas formicarius]|uniref:kinetochore protein NDC80 homolog n=1 Tax=Cylas formicarius TaxID=197179 RepID=UPI002958B56D|nr:kinetochore protein NDC80 homolog [Cylas formicarius]